MDDKNARLEAERITGRGTDRDWESATRVQPDLAPSQDVYPTPLTPAARTAGTSHTDVASASSGYEPLPASAEDDAGVDEHTRQLRAEIEETRSEMSETVNAIQERLRPSNIAANAADSVRGKAASAAGTVREAASNAFGTVREAVSSATDTVREATGTGATNVRSATSPTGLNFAESEPARYLRDNPAQSAMLAAGVGGLAWMLFGRRGAARRRPLPTVRPSNAYRRTQEYGLGDSREQYDAGADYGQLGSSSARRMASGGSRGTDEGRSTSHRMRAQAESAQPASPTVEDAQGRTRGTTRRAKSQVRRAWNDNPLLIGAAAAVVGAIVGAAMPETDRENAWLGEKRDTMIDDVQQSVRETVTKVQQVATAAVGLVTDRTGRTGSPNPAPATESGANVSAPSSQPPSWQTPGGSGGVI